MRALRVIRPNSIAIEEVAEPSTRSEDHTVVVRPLMVGLCGTDLEILDGDIDEAFVRYPVTIGHEWVGELVNTLAGTPDRPALPAGSRVVVEGIIACGACPACERGDTNLCATYAELGFTHDGAAAQLVEVPAHSVWPIDERVATETAVLVEPAAVVWHALQLARPVTGDRVLVVGDGTVGLIATRMTRLRQPATVDLLGARPEQESLAHLMGVDRFLLTTQPGPATRNYDVVIVATGSLEAAEQSLRWVRRGGRVVLLGFPGAGRKLGATVDELVNNEIALLGSFAYTRADWQSVVHTMNSGNLDLRGLVTHRFDLEQYPEAFALLRSPLGTRGKIVLLPGQQGESMVT